MTQEAAVLRDILRRVAVRIGAGHALRWIARAASAVGLAVLVWALGTMVIPIALPIREVAIAATAALAIGGGLLVRLLRPSLLTAARITDHRLALADRLSTAVELLGQLERPRGLARLQIIDAVEVARRVVPRAAAPITVPRAAWVAAGLVGVLVLWTQLFQGLTIPGLPAARNAAVIHYEGRTLSAIGRHFEAASRGQGLPETRRAAPNLINLGQRLQAPRVTRPDALRMLHEADRQLRSAQSRVERRLGGAGERGAQGTPDARVPASSPADAGRLQRAIQELQSLTERLRHEQGAAQEDLARLGAVSDSLEQMDATTSARREMAKARRELQQGRPGSAASALGDAMRDLEGLERMLGDDRALGEAKRQVEKSADRIAQGGPLGAGHSTANQSSSESASPPRAPGPNPVEPTSEDAAPPLPGPNQGHLPGEGRGPQPGAPTPRLGGTRTDEHLTGRQGEGTAITRDLLAPGRTGAPQLPASAVPADVAHQNDRALAREPFPPAYVTLIRRYFETLENGR